MRSGSAIVGNDEGKKKYHIYVEEYVLSYLRRESDSLELSEIYFYGSRGENGKKFYVYGAGRSKGIAAFAEYDPLSELVCRLTQAGPVFLVREPDGECRTTGFQVFYDNNEAMQNYLLEWTGSTGQSRIAEKQNVQETQPAPPKFPELPKEEKKRPAHSAMSVQLCLILVVLVAIVITSTDSYDKMEGLNQSAKEVFFAIENQEAEDRSGAEQIDGETDKKDANREDAKEIVVERALETDGETERDETEKLTRETDDGETADDQLQEADTDGKELAEQEEGVLKPAEEAYEENDGQDPEGESDSEKAQEKEETLQEETGLADTEEEEKEDEEEPAEQSEEENEEAFSRSITRYYEVEQGDTLYTISQEIYGDISRVGKICEANQISDPDKIRSGQRIILP